MSFWGVEKSASLNSEAIRQIIQPEERHGLLANEIGTGSVRDRPSATGGCGTLGRDPQLPGAQHDLLSDAGRRPGLFLPLKLHNPSIVGIMRIHSAGYPDQTPFRTRKSLL